MKYNFKNTETGEIVVKEFPMTEVPGEFIEYGIRFKRDLFSEFKSSGKPAVIIPRHMRAGNY